MDYKNKAIVNPDSRAISDAKQRCLTKCFGIFGLGCYLYAGSDLPRDSDPPEVVTEKKVAKPKATKRSPKKAVDEAKGDITSLTYDEVSIDGQIADRKETVTDLHKRGWTPANDATKKAITNAIKSRDSEALIRLKKEILATADVALKLHDAEEEEHDG